MAKVHHYPCVLQMRANKTPFKLNYKLGLKFNLAHKLPH